MTQPTFETIAHTDRHADRPALEYAIKILPSAQNTPGRLAEAEIHFRSGILAGMKLIGFAIWARRSGTGKNVTFPARQYRINGESRSFALLRPVSMDAPSANVRDLILEAYEAYAATLETDAR